MTALRSRLPWLVAVGLVALFAPTVMWLWERWTLSVWHNAHGLLLVPVVAYPLPFVVERFTL